MTLVYAGEIADRSPVDFNTMAKDAITCGRLTGAFRLEVAGVEVFGPEGEQVDVLTFLPTPKLVAARQLVQYWNASQYKEFKPHATIGPAGSAANNPMGKSEYDDVPAGGHRGYPLSLFFTKIAACWGDQKLIFELGSDY